MAKSISTRLLDAYSQVQDSIRNLLTMIGTSGDKRTGDHEIAVDWPPGALENIYRGNAIAARAVNLPVDEALMRGWGVQGLTEDEVKRLRARADDVQLIARLKEAAAWARCYGGAALVIAPEPGTGALSEPLAPGNRVLWAQTFRCDEMWVERWGESAEEKEFRSPVMWRIQPPWSSSVDVHPSRVIHFAGPVASFFHRYRLRGHGDSVLARMMEAIWGYDHSWASVDALLRENGMTSVAFDNLAELLKTSGEAKVKTRLLIMKELQRTLGVRLIDVKDRVHREGVPLAGVADVLDRMAVRVAGVVGCPASVLFGQAPAGLNATGDMEMERWRDGVEAWRASDLRPAQDRALRALFFEPDSVTGGQEPATWETTYPPLKVETLKERAERHEATSRADLNYWNTGALSSEQITNGRFGPDGSMDADLRVDGYQPPKLLGAPTPQRERNPTLPSLTPPT